MVVWNKDTNQKIILADEISLTLQIVGCENRKKLDKDRLKRPRKCNSRLSRSRRLNNARETNISEQILAKQLQ